MTSESKEKIKIIKNGPYQVKGNIPLSQLAYIIETGGKMTFEDEKKYDTGETYFICRCGKTKNHPFCDGAHTKETPFNGTETADQAGNDEKIEAGISPKANMLINKPTGIYGPMVVAGRVSVESSKGGLYPLRNKVALCTCGKSKNKPFCDGSHAQ